LYAVLGERNPDGTLVVWTGPTVSHPAVLFLSSAVTLLCCCPAVLLLCCLYYCPAVLLLLCCAVNIAVCCACWQAVGQAAMTASVGGGEAALVPLQLMSDDGHHAATLHAAVRLSVPNPLTTCGLMTITVKVRLCFVYLST
jgi:hypothetical protein